MSLLLCSFAFATELLTQPPDAAPATLALIGPAFVAVPPTDPADMTISARAGVGSGGSTAVLAGEAGVGALFGKAVTIDDLLARWIPAQIGFNFRVSAAVGLGGGEERWAVGARTLVLSSPAKHSELGRFRDDFEDGENIGKKGATDPASLAAALHAFAADEERAALVMSSGGSDARPRQACADALVRVKVAWLLLDQLAKDSEDWPRVREVLSAQQARALAECDALLRARKEGYFAEFSGGLWGEEVSEPAAYVGVSLGRGWRTGSLGLLARPTWPVGAEAPVMAFGLVGDQTAPFGALRVNTILTADFVGGLTSSLDAEYSTWLVGERVAGHVALGLSARILPELAGAPSLILSVGLDGTVRRNRFNLADSVFQ